MNLELMVEEKIDYIKEELPSDYFHVFNSLPSELEDELLRCIAVMIEAVDRVNELHEIAYNN